MTDSIIAATENEIAAAAAETNADTQVQALDTTVVESAPEGTTQERRQKPRSNHAPASPNKLASLLSIGVGGASRSSTKHSAHAGNQQAMEAIKGLGITKKTIQQAEQSFIVVSYEKTSKLGLFLERTAKASFTYPNMGEWMSVAGLRSFLETSWVDQGGQVVFDDTWRLIHSYECKRKANQWHNNGGSFRTIKDIKVIVADATYQKILQNQEYMFLMTESEGTFVNTTGDDYTRDWYMLALEEIRQSFKDRHAAALQIQEAQGQAFKISNDEAATEEDKAVAEELNNTVIPQLFSQLESIVPDFSGLNAVEKFPQRGHHNSRRR